MVHKDSPKKELADYELESFLEQFDATIQSEMSELLCRSFQKQLGSSVSDEISLDFDDLEEEKKRCSFVSLWSSVCRDV